MNILKRWKYVMDMGNLPEGEKMDFVSKWLLLTRAYVFSMTITSVFVGALIAFGDGEINWLYLGLIVVAMILAHASNNLINDYFDYKQGVDTADYERVQYGPHPIVSKLMTEKSLLATFAIFGLIELAVAIYLSLQVGWVVMAFAVTGFALSVFYVAPPFKLKYHGLGEFAIFLIWGPLVTVGTYFVMTKTMPLHVWFVSIPYGLVVMNVLLGKHLDKFEKDKEKGVKTLPVVLGWGRAMKFLKLSTAMFYITIVILVLFQMVTPFVLIAFFSIGRFRKFFEYLDNPKPEKQPENFPIWPLWYVAWAFWFNKLAGGLFIFGLMLGLVPWGKLFNCVM